MDIDSQDNTEAGTAASGEAKATPSDSRFPSYYYGDPMPAASKLPRWLPVGCGLLSIAALIVLFALGSFFVNDGLPTILGFVFSNIEDELDKQFGPDVTPAERQSLKHELDLLASAVSKRKVSATDATKILRELQSMIVDGKVSRSESAALTRDIESILGGKPEPPAVVRP